MEIIINAIFGWITSRILDKLFRRKTTKEVLEINNRRLIELLEEHEEAISQLEKENRKKELETSSIFQSIKRSGLSTEKLIAEHNRPINAILICAYFQKIPDGTPYGKAEKFVFDELQRYDCKSLGGGIYLIPPKNVPEIIHDKNDLHKWFDSEILKGRYCKLKFLLLVDLRKNAYWMNNLPYQPTDSPFHRINRNIGEVLSLEDIFNEDQISRTTTIAKIIGHGDIGWLAHKHISEDDLTTIRLNQVSIENKLGNPTLRELKSVNYQRKLKTVLDEFGINNSEEVSKSIISEAKFWHSRLK
jgi:hypothetical protein